MLKFIVSFVLWCLLVGVQARIFELDAMLRFKTPDRCINNSVTPVSCAKVTSADVLVPHPDDCRLFYYCVQRYLPPVCRQCPANLHFNPTIHVCDWPSQAGCNLATTTAEAPAPTASDSSFVTTSNDEATAERSTTERPSSRSTTEGTSSHSTTQGASYRSTTQGTSSSSNTEETSSTSSQTFAESSLQQASTITTRVIQTAASTSRTRKRLSWFW